MRSARFGALLFILALFAVAAYPQQPGLAAGSWEETTSADLDGDGLSQEYELGLAQHFFPTIWYDSGEDTSSPGGNHDHRENNQPGRLLFRVRPHPQVPSKIAITYALLYRIDGGEGFGATWACHMGDVEPFAISLKPDPSCALGYRMESITTWAHEGTSSEHVSTRYADGCNWGFSVAAVSFTDAVLSSENKHGNYLSDSECDGALGGLENCNYDWTAVDVNAWTGLNVGESSAQRHADLSPLGFDNQLWAGQNFCGGPHSDDDLGELNDCLARQGCPSAAETKFADKFVSPVATPPEIPPNYVGCYTDDPNRALPYWLGSVGDIQSCVNIARANGLAYAGLQWYGECWGGNELRYTQVGDWECNTPCASGQMCGGGWRNSIYATGSVPGGMSPDSAVRGCSDWYWWSPVYRPDPASCHAYCAQNGANACEWYANGDCYVEFGSGCYVQGGFPGWWASVF